MILCKAAIYLKNCFSLLYANKQTISTSTLIESLLANRFSYRRILFLIAMLGLPGHGGRTKKINVRRSKSKDTKYRLCPGQIERRYFTKVEPADLRCSDFFLLSPKLMPSVGNRFISFALLSLSFRNTIYAYFLGERYKNSGFRLLFDGATDCLRR